MCYVLKINCNVKFKIIDLMLMEIIKEKVIKVNITVLLNSKKKICAHKNSRGRKI